MEPDENAVQPVHDETPVTSERKGKKLALLVLNTVFYVFIIFCVVLVGSSLLSKFDKSLFGLRGYIVMTGSMSPTFEAGGFIVIRDKKPENIQVGDILSYKLSDNTTLTHRVIEVVKTNGDYSFITKGDANNLEDAAPVTPDKILGVAFLWINGVGYLLVKLQHPLAIVAIFVVIGLSLIVPEIVSMIRKKSKSGVQK